MNWIYDGIYRLTQETISGSAKNGTVNYGLDAVGNRLLETSSLPGIVSGAFSYDTNDRLSTETYDANGNTTVSGAKTFAYDFENRLKFMNGAAVTLLYDGDGNRVGKSATRYLVDELNPTGYAQVVEELSGGLVQRTYTYGLQRISQTQTGGASFYGYDGFGSVRTLTNASGTVTDTYDYGAWGNAVNQTGSTPNVYLYRGEQYDPDLNLYYLRARYLNPLTGRFFSTDPEPGSATVPASLHRYVYGYSDPITNSDPSGRLVGERELLLRIPLAVSVAVEVAIAAQIYCIWSKAAAWLRIGEIVASGTAIGGVRQFVCGVEPTPTCASSYPNYAKCGALEHQGYNCGPFGQAFGKVRAYWSPRPLGVKNQALATRGPCSISSGTVAGQHYSLRFLDGVKGKDYPGSIGCCNCCDDGGGAAKLETRCKVLNVNHQPPPF